jgi:phage repressor protein C with HTH and peptisase S24 domain/DNA-binding XRE family transcriptional regulator
MSEIVGSRLKSARRLAGLTQKHVYEKLGVAQSTYSSWETGKAEPDLETTRVICEIINISMDDLLGVRTDSHLKTTLRPDEKFIIETYRYLDNHGKEVINTLLILEKSRLGSDAKRFKIEEKIPFKVYTQKASAGFGNYLSEDSDFDIFEVNADLIPPKAQFGIRISGESMEPQIQNGQIVLVEPAVQLENNDIGIFVYDGEAFCKKLKVDHYNEEIVLISINKNYEPIKVNDHELLRTVGKVVGQIGCM